MVAQFADLQSIDAWSFAILLLLSFGIVYVFYPALSISTIRSHTSERLLSRPSSAQVLLSIVIPAYNEEDRLPIMLDAALASIDKHRKKIVELVQAHSSTASNATAMEWIVVSDGSTDGTSQVVEQYARNASQHNNHHHDHHDQWKLLTLYSNSGKGAAVKAGMEAARGEMQLMVDADGATDFDALLLLLMEMKNARERVAPKLDVVFGSRAHLAKSSNSQVHQRSLLRSILMHAFHFCVRILVGSNIQDTQCGFKLFTRDAANALFQNLHLRRWAFDIELVILASRLKINIAEVSVPWHEVEGSKLDSSKLQLALVAVGMLRDMLCVRLCYILGIWTIRRDQSLNK